LLFIFFFLSLFCRQALIYKYNMTDLEVQKKSEKKFFVYIFFQHIKFVQKKYGRRITPDQQRKGEKRI